MSLYTIIYQPFISHPFSSVFSTFHTIVWKSVKTCWNKYSTEESLTIFTKQAVFNMIFQVIPDPSKSTLFLYIIQPQKPTYSYTNMQIYRYINIRSKMLFLHRLTSCWYVISTCVSLVRVVPCQMMKYRVRSHLRLIWA